jgi:hypothetical protein
MANPADILNDPDFVSANAATKQAIFAKHVATDPDFLKANPDTQQAIKARFGFAGNEGMPAARQGVDQFGIPVTIRPPQTEAPLTLREKISGAIETPIALAANLASGPITYLAGAGGPEFQKKVAGEIQYQPRTRLAQQALETVGQGLEASKIPPFMPMIGGTANALAPAGRAAPAVAENALAAARATPLVQAVEAPLAARAAKIQEANVTQSFQNAPKIEAAQTANQLGIVLNPAVSNPTKGNKIRAAIAGDTNTNAVLAQANEPKWTQLAVEKGLDLPPNTRLDASAIQTALDNASKPYDVVREIPQILPDEATIKTLESLKKQPSAVAKGKVEASNTLIDNMIAEIQQGRSGADVLNDIRQLRAEANSVYKARDKGLNVPKASEVAEADACMGIANAYEKMIDANVTDPQVLADLQAARTKMAQIYDIERATDFATNRIDPKAFAKMLDERKGKMTGIGADIGRIAANYPEIAKIGAQGSTEAKLTRGGVAGTIGFGLGTLVGAPVAGSVLGGAAGYLAGKASSKAMTNPAYQAAKAVPPDYRPNTLAPINRNALSER